MKRLLSILAACLVVSAIPAAAQVTRVVDDDGYGSPTDCDDTTMAFTTPAAAMAASSSGDTVLVCPGTYVGTVNFAGKAVTLRSVAGPAATILDGNAAGSVVVFATNEGAGSTLEGFTIRNGRSDPTGDGGGIRIDYASPTIRGNVIVGNVACQGSGVSIRFGSPLIEENLVADNAQGGCSGGTGGGGIGVGGSGAAVIRRNIIRNNATGTDGGGISLVAAGSPTVEFNLISGNSSLRGGAIAMGNQADANITNNLIVGNTAYWGGGVYWLVPQGTRGPRLVNNTIAANAATLGSGIFADGFESTTDVANNIIVGTPGKAAVYCGDFDPLNGPVFRSNDVYAPSGQRYGGSCADQTGSNGNMSADPLFADVDRDDYHLLPGSPAIDAGSNSAPGVSAVDFDLHQRVLDGNGDGSAIVDIGADEAPASGSAPGSFSKTRPADMAQQQPGDLVISWITSADATSYEYCYDTTDNGTCDGKWMPAWAGNAAPLTGLASVTTYYWQVRARNAAGIRYGDGTSAAYWRFTTKVIAPLPFGKTSPAMYAMDRPTNLLLSWEPSAGAATYEYCYDIVENASCDSNWVSAGTSTSAMLSGLIGYTSYYWQVRAVNADGTTYANGSSTAFWNFRTGTQLPPLPGAFGMVAPADGAVNQPTTLNLNWQASSGVTAYLYCYDTINDGNCNVWISSGSNTSVTVSGLIGGTTYYWHVRAVNGGGTTEANGNTSTYWAFTTRLEAPGPFAKTSPADGVQDLQTNVLLLWQPTPGAASWEYCYDTVDNGTCDGTWISAGNQPRGAALGLRQGTTYYWQVRAVSPGGTTYADGGAVWSFTTQSTAPMFGTGPYDFFGASRGDIAVWRPTSGVWFIKKSASDYTSWASYQWGVAALGDRPVAADYDGDGRTDIAVWRESTGTWFVRSSSTSFDGWFSVQWGQPGDRPVPADYDGDGRVDLAVWRPSNGVWYLLLSGTDYRASAALQWGVSALQDVPLPADYDGDGRADLAVWRPGPGLWYIKTSSSNYASFFAMQWGVGELGDVPVIGDYDGDGRTDIAVWRPGECNWYVKRSSTSYSTWFVVQWGAGSDVPAPADYDGDGRTDIAVWRPGSGTWFVKPSRASYASYFTVQWGIEGDRPLGGASR